jgi:hypothetical protein
VVDSQIGLSRRGLRRQWEHPLTQVAGETASEAELGVRGDDEPVRGGGAAEPGSGSPQSLLEHPGGVLDIEPQQEAYQSRSTSCRWRRCPGHHDQTGLGSPPLGGQSTFSRITVPSRMGSFVVEAEPGRPGG